MTQFDLLTERVGRSNLHRHVAEMWEYLKIELDISKK